MTRGSNSAYLFSQALNHSPADSVSKSPMCKKLELQSLYAVPRICLYDNLISGVLSLSSHSPFLGRVHRLKSSAVVATATASGPELTYGHALGRMGSAPSQLFAKDSIAVPIVVIRN